MTRNLYPERQTSDDLVATKLEMPQLAARVVKRSHLTSLLQAGLTSKVSLIVAPAGYGKTTLLGEWVTRGFPAGWYIAWISLDIYDNKITRFWSYIVGAIQKFYPKLKNNIQQLLQSSTDLNDFSFLNPLINEIRAYPYSICLILDDYHLITNEQIHQSLSYFIDHQPKNFHLSIASRTTPPIAFSRIRAQGHLIEVLITDLTFSLQEVDVFFKNVMDMDLGHDQITVLANATEGWIAGLKLAALSIRSRNEFQGVHPDLNGINQRIFEFLLEEVLNQQDNKTKEFLLKTSVLPEFSVPLCNSIFERSDSRKILNQVIRKNLFVLSLDNNQTWYRYHQLFSETLRMRLQETCPECIDTIQRKACRWMQENGYPDKAVSYALDTGDLECAAKIIEICALDALTKFNLTMLVQWVNRLSPDLLEERLQLGIYVALAYFLMGKVDEVIPRLALVEHSLDQKISKSDSDKENSYIRWQIAALKAEVKCLSGKVEDGIPEIINLRKDPPKEDVYFVGSMTHILADSYVLIGQLDLALEEFKRGMDFALKHNLFFEYAYSLTGHAHVLKMQGNLHLLELDYQRLLDYSCQYELNELFTAYAQTGLAEIAIEKNNFAIADRLIQDVEENLEMISRVPKTWLRPEFIYCRLAKYYFGYRDFEKVNYYLGLAMEGIFENPRATFFLMSDLINLQVRVWETTANFEKNIFDLMSELADLNFNKKPIIAERTAFARIYLSQNMVSKASAILDEIYIFTRKAGMRERLIEVLILRARISFVKNEILDTFQNLFEALLIAEREGYIRPFIEEYHDMKSLLEQTLIWIKEKKPAPENEKISDFILLLLANFDSKTKPLSTTNIGSLPQTIQLTPILEPLSSREDEVITLLIEGKTTKEIAKELMISMNTTKTHLRKIYKKLAVHSKEDALRVILNSRNKDN